MSRLSLSDPLFYETVFFICTLVSLWHGLRYYRLARKVKDLDFNSTIRSAAQGYIQLEGIALAIEQEPVIAPHSHRKCVWYEYIFEEKIGDHYITKERTITSNRFLLKDHTGCCVIHPFRAEVSHPTNTVWHIDEGGRTARITENVILPNARLVVIGEFTGQDANANREIEVTELLREWKKDFPALLKRYDKSQDGKFSEQEWQAVIEEANKQVYTQKDKLIAEIDALPAIQKPQDVNHTWLIAQSRSSEKLVNTYQFQTKLALICFLISGILFSYNIPDLGKRLPHLVPTKNTSTTSASNEAIIPNSDNIAADNN